jgi:hypothetical protein
MALTSFTDLTAALADWADRTDLTARIPDFIALAEARIGRELRIRALEFRSQMSTVSGQDYYALPTGYKQARHFKLVDGEGGVPSDLEYQTPEALDVTNSRQFGGGSGFPKYYTIVSNEIRIVPTPSAVYTLEILYYKAPTALSSANQANLLLEENPDIYLYGSLIELWTYLRDDAESQKWGLMFGKAIEAAQTSDQRDRHSGGALHITGEHHGW